MTSVTEIERLTSELKNVIENAQQLLHATSQGIEGSAGEARARAQRTLREASRSLRRSRRALADRGRIAALVTDRYVHARPWRSIGVAAGVAFAIGCLIASRERD